MDHLMGKPNLLYLVGIHDEELKLQTLYLQHPATWVSLVYLAWTTGILIFVYKQLGEVKRQLKARGWYQPLIHGYPTPVSFAPNAKCPRRRGLIVNSFSSWRMTRDGQPAMRSSITQSTHVQQDKPAIPGKIPMATSLVPGSERSDFKLHTGCLLAFWTTRLIKFSWLSTQKMKNKDYQPTCQSDPVGDRANDSVCIGHEKAHEHCL